VRRALGELKESKSIETLGGGKARNFGIRILGGISPQKKQTAGIRSIAAVGFSESKRRIKEVYNDQGAPRTNLNFELQ